MWALLEVHIHDSIHYVAFGVCPVFLGMLLRDPLRRFWDGWFALFNYWVEFHCLDTSQFVYPCTTDGCLGSFPSGAILNKAVLYFRISVQTQVFISCSVNAQSEIAGTYGKCLRNSSKELSHVSEVAVTLCVPARNRPTPHLLGISVFGFRHFGERGVMCFCDSNLCLPNC